MIAAPIPEATICQLLDDHELLQVGAAHMHVQHRFSDRGFDVHYTNVAHKGQKVPAVLIRSKDDGRAVAYPLTELVEAAQRVMQSNKKGGIAR